MLLAYGVDEHISNKHAARLTSARNSKQISNVPRQTQAEEEKRKVGRRAWHFLSLLLTSAVPELNPAKAHDSRQ